MFDFNHQRSKNYEEVFVLALYDSFFFFFQLRARLLLVLCLWSRCVQILEMTMLCSSRFIDTTV